MLIARCRITVRGILGETAVAAYRLGDWVAHRQVDTPDLYGLTLLPLGMSLPFCWASFATPVRAVLAMREIVRLRNSWSVMTQADFTLGLRDQLEAICARHHATEGPVQIQWPADRDMLGLPLRERLNGYALPV
jgi:hypothetical protein